MPEQNLIDAMNALVRAIKPLGIARIEDLPYTSSAPVQFVYQSTCDIGQTSSGNAGLAGNYIWDDRPSPMTPARPLGENTLYFIRALTMTADVNQNHYPQSITEVPRFYLYKESSLAAPILREPVIMPSFLENFEYRMGFFTSDPNDQLLGAWEGQLYQIADLTGKEEITLTCTISAQEIIDQNFIDLYKKAYPET